jgi:hypothetical protein
VTTDERLAELFVELRGLGLPCLVMGGHAVRYYGVDRSTFDFDFHLALDASDWARLDVLLARSPAFAHRPEGPSWRPKIFRRFVVGTLADGREERAEFWRENHLLAPFPDLARRAETGIYGGEQVAFLGMADLIRSKETEREDDWRDVGLLEELHDARLLAAAKDPPSIAKAMSSLRSQRGWESAQAVHDFALPGVVETAWGLATHPISLAMLAPSVGGRSTPVQLKPPIARIIDGPLRGIAPNSPRHRALVEAVRRLYVQQRMSEDRADKERAGA